MSGAKHTPGPWQALYVGCEKAVLIGTVDGVTAFARMERFDGTPSDEAQEANAALIAAAPDMLSALQFVSGYIEGQIATEVAGLESPPIHWETLVEAVNAAIAKAEGRS